MCHFGNPFLEAAAAVLEKNPNVCADLSGLLEGRADLDRYFVERAGYVGLLRTWMDYLGCWDPLPVRHRLAHRQSGGIPGLRHPHRAGGAPPRRLL